MNYKVRAWVNVGIHLLLVDGILRLLAPILVPFAFLLKFMGKYSPLWIFLEDDTNNYGVPEERIKTWSWLATYNEVAIRNHCSNLNSLLFLKGEYRNLRYEYCETWTYKPKSTVKTIDYTHNTTMLRAKFYNDNPNNVHNRGKYLNLDKSYFGRKLYYFQRGNRWYVLYSKCWIDEYNEKDGSWFSRKRKGYVVKERNYGASDRILIRRKKSIAL